MSRAKLKFIVWLLVAVALVYWFVQRLDWPAVKSSFSRMNGTLAVLAVAPIILTYLVRALRWRTLLAPIGSPSLRGLFSATVIGYAGIFVLGRVGEVVRPVMLSLRERIRPSATVATIMVERIYDMVFVAVVFALDLSFFHELKGGSAGGLELTALKETGLVLLLVSVVGILGLFVFRLRAASALDFLERRLAWMPKRLRTVILNLVHHVAEGLYVLHDVRGLAVTVGYTILTWSLVVVSFSLITLAFGVRLSVASVIFVIGFAMVGSLVPTPGGSAGAFHTATMIGLTLLGVERNTAAGVAIVTHIIAFGTALFIGPFFLVRGGISLNELRRMVQAELNTQARTAGGERHAEPHPIGAKL
jgi:hypothetical protein